MYNTAHRLCAGKECPMKRFAACSLACLMILMLLAGCGTKTPHREPDVIIAELINEFGYNSDEAAAERLLSELKETDLEQWQLWDGLVDYWGYVNKEMPIRKDHLPDDLPQDDSLCIVVLGYQLNTDGSMRDELIGRLETALACAKQYPNAYVLCTGGKTAGMAPNKSEGGSMTEWLKQHGVSPKRLITEDCSLTTTENATLSDVILRTSYPQIRKVAIVSSGYHIPWGALMFEAEFRLSGQDIQVSGNCAYDIKTSVSAYDIQRCETAGMFTLLNRYAPAPEVTAAN